MTKSYIVSFKSQGDINSQFIYLCTVGKLEGVQSLLTSDEIKYHPDLRSQETGLKRACQHNNVEVLKYLLFDFNISVSDELKKWIQGENEDDTYYCFAYRLLEKRELKAKLSESLLSESQVKARIKI